MSRKISPFLLLLYILWSTELFAQNLSLTAIGASEKETKTIDSLGYQSVFQNFTSLDLEVKNLHKRLTSIGYIENELIDLKKNNDSSYVANFSLKQKYRSIIVEHRGLVDLSILKLTGYLNKKQQLIIPIENVESTLQSINSEIANRGNPFSSLTLNNITKISKDILSGSLSISDPKSRTIDQLILKGYEKFPKSFVKRYLKIKTGQTFSLEKIKEKTAALNDLVFANQIKDPEVLFTQDSTILYMYIEKARSNTFDGFLGFGTNETTNKIEFDGYLDLNLTNNLNYGESLKLLYKSDENEQQTFDLKLNAPYIFNSPVGVDLNLNIFKRDSSFVTVSQAAKINYQINSKHVVSAGINTVTSTDLLDLSTATITDYKSNQYLINYTFTKRQNYDFLFPLNFVFDISTGFGNRSYENTDERQANFSLNTFKIFNLNDKNSIYTRVSSQYLASDSYLENELPRFGGINSIRGFEENSLVANLYGVLNTEYRYKLNNTIYIHSVIDAAYFENQIANQKEKLFGFGFGFGLLTKAGLFRFNYTSGKTENQKFRLSDSKIHLSLTTRF
ncbi:outer membrane protein assembly factor [Psychroserpens algicola]|uniref:Outer membrane protein assembly factor n=1 Tax=Psychroserpens algicola TaxID=1719034 RepID=A0ABT0H859_9FLAO|nr:outer membrane protein assembly factor [Psychroserpens algicola]MCK8480037.1 outer membrane protein assembly factor [Psychroserpens algicola]